MIDYSFIPENNLRKHRSSFVHDWYLLQMEQSFDALTAAPGNHILLFENDLVRVLDTRLPAGEQTPVHEHSLPSASILLSWSDFHRFTPEGTLLFDSSQIPAPDIGSVIWMDSLPKHYAVNTGKTELRTIAVEIKK